MRMKGGHAIARRWPAIGLALVAPLLFVWLATVRLDAQGLYYDEVHQAPAAFAYLGRTVPFFGVGSMGEAVASAPVPRGLRIVPLLNLPYSGAIKSAVYGLYLRLLGSGFTVISWRLVGVLTVAVGIGLFVGLAQRAVSTPSLALVVGLLLTDVTVILASRHDWGPVALAVALRLVLIGVWLRGAASPVPSLANSFALGLLVGVAVFEKLSSIVLLLPLAVFVWPRAGATVRHLGAVGVGLLVGAAPLVVLNAASWALRGQVISLSSLEDSALRSWPAFLRYVHQYLDLGAGAEVRSFILGSPASPWVTALELWLMVSALTLAAWGASRKRSRCLSARMSLQALVAYVAIGVGVYLLPREIWVHHWVLGTPFQYVAVALAVDSARRPTGVGHGRLATYGLLAIVTATLVTRAIGLTSLELALQRGDAAKSWHPELTRVARFAATRAGEAAFIAADWGVGTQVFCLGQGRPGLIKELFREYRGPDDLVRFREEAGVDAYYALSLRPPSGVAPGDTARILRDLESEPGWREMKVEPELRNLAAVAVRKFLFVSPAERTTMSPRSWRPELEGGGQSG